MSTVGSIIKLVRNLFENPIGILFHHEVTFLESMQIRNKKIRQVSLGSSMNNVCNSMVFCKYGMMIEADIMGSKSTTTSTLKISLMSVKTLIFLLLCYIYT